ncbi:hypothetical protein NMY22_g15826 [Coprinellus aureogranulatus]|nr:hypothetical protein NMY22_g15826 [Coprinellus aureogranulatus]
MYPYESPARPALPSAPAVSQPLESGSEEEDEEEEGDDDDDDTEVEDEPIRQPRASPAIAHIRTGSGSRPATRNNDRAHANGAAHDEQAWGTHPVSAPTQAPNHGSRHTHAISIPESHQAPAMPYLPPYQPPPSAIHSASSAIPEHPPRHSRNSHSSSSSRREAPQHRSRHSASQVPTVPGNGNAQGHRRRRTSLASVPTLNLNQGSLSSLSLHSIGSAPAVNQPFTPSLLAQSSGSASIVPPASVPIANHRWDGEDGYHTDVPSSSNALGLAISDAERDYTIRHRTAGTLPISQPRPVPVGQTNFLRSLSRDNYRSED